MLFFILFFLIQFINNLATIKFKTFYPTTYNMKLPNPKFKTEDYIRSIVLSKIYFEVITGNETTEKSNKSQILNIFSDTKTNEFYIESYENFYFYDEDYDKLCNYSFLLSNTYKKIETPVNEESFKIYTDINLFKYQYMKLQFFEDRYHQTEELLCGKIGTGGEIKIENEMNFIQQIIKNLNSSDKTFVFKYSNKTSDEGLIIIGDIPHNILSNEFNEKNLISFNAGNNNIWSIRVDNIIFEGYNINTSAIYNKVEIAITTEFDGLLFPEFYITQLNNIFFNKYYKNNTCMNKTKYVYNKYYTIFSCNGNYFGKYDIKQFPRISFIDYRTNLNFSFEGEELFYFRDGRYYLKIYQATTKVGLIEFGRIFLKKYLTVFDFGNKLISFYKKEEAKDNKNDGENNLWKILLIVFLGSIISFLILGIFIGKTIYQKRKKRVNELDDDDYLYNPNINDDNGEQKLFNEENIKRN